VIKSNGSNSCTVSETGSTISTKIKQEIKISYQDISSDDEAKPKVDEQRELTALDDPENYETLRPSLGLAILSKDAKHVFSDDSIFFDYVEILLKSEFNVLYTKYVIANRPDILTKVGFHHGRMERSVLVTERRL